MLINDIETLRNYIPTIIAGDYKKYATYISAANDWLKKEVLGKSLFAEIENLEPTNQQHTELIKKCETVVANKGYLEAIPFMDLIETESGFAVVRTDQLVPASRDRVDALLSGIKHKLGEAIEDLIDYLEESEEYHELWKGSETYSLLTDVYISTLKQFRRYAEFSGNRAEFINFKPNILNAINLFIEPVISKELSDQIIEQTRDNELTESNKAIIENLRFAMALYSIQKTAESNIYLNKVRNELLKNPDNYPAFKGSEIYAKYLARTKTQNTGKIFKAVI